MRIHDESHIFEDESGISGFNQFRVPALSRYELLIYMTFFSSSAEPVKK